MNIEPDDKNTDGAAAQAVEDPLVNRATRLFEFLIRVQQVTSRPIRHVDNYGRDDGAVIWFHQIPDHRAVAAATRGADPEPVDPILVLNRIPRLAPPEPADELAPWVEGRTDDPDSEPDLKDRAVLPTDEDEHHESENSDEPGEDEGAPDVRRPARILRLEDHPEVEDRFLSWLEDWETWAANERAARPARDLYNEVFRAYLTQTNAPEEWEAIVGVGALAWHPEGHDPVLRHCLTHPVVFDFDDDTGRLTVNADSDGQLAVELEMLDMLLWPDQPRLQEVKKAAAQHAGHVLHRDDVGEIARRLAHNLSSEGTYRDEERAGTPEDVPTCSFAPALVLRRRTHQGLQDIFQTIKTQIEERGTVPAGLRVLLDPGQAPEVTEVDDPATGAWVEDGDDVYLPLPVNDRQREVVERVDKRAMTLVQGPPGTGKTHTAAALISHLLAQGKRVLVTAQTDQALKEVRLKLPPEIQDLSVSVVGAGREELSNLRVAVKKLSEAATEYTEAAAEERTHEAEEAISDLKGQKAQTARQLLEAREAETLHLEHAGYEGTLAQIAAEHAEADVELGWLAEISAIDPSSDAPLTDSEAVELLTLLRDRDLHADEHEAWQDLPDIDQLPAPPDYAELLDQEGQAAGRAAQQQRLRDHEAYDAIAQLDPDIRHDLRRRIDELAVRADELARRNEQWMSEALTDVRSGKLHTWRSRHDQVSELTSRSRPLVEQLGSLVDVRVATSNVRPLLPHARAVREHLAEGKTVKVDPTTHKPKQGVFTAKVLKDAQPLFDQVQVDGLAPTTTEAIDTFTTWVETTRLLDALDQAWPLSLTIPPEDSFVERLAWHDAELQVLTSVIALGQELAAEEERLTELGVPKPDWNDLEGVRRFAQLVDAADAAEAHGEAQGPLVELEELLADAARWETAAPVVHRLHQTVQQGDANQYRDVRQRLRRLLHVREQCNRRDELVDALASANPTAARQLAGDPTDERWDVRLRRFEDAWRWAATASWIQRRSNVDINALQGTCNDIEDRIRDKVATLASVRAWSKAVDRLGQQQRADLTQYAQLVQSFGKTGGKYANERRVEMRDAMQRCRPSVPVWIMPLYRIAQSLQVDADLFDVVVVDEASQAGLESTFLQYLAPKIVVIGDDKQNSPRAVGVDQSQLRSLAEQFLHDDRYRASWQDPKRSLFDEARMRFGDLITLTEHRRCVPDIIGFSNRIAYEPEGIRLLPVRQTGSDALEPIKPVLVEDGYIRGTRNKANPPEVDAIVEQVQKCLADERYDGLTFGVISLTGPHQAKVIEKELMDRVDPREWQARDLRCGTAPDFQGSERHVMFLSMVTTLDEDRRYAPLTADMYLQQFNVAASRAQEQMWLFHSIRPQELTNHDDMRYQLLDYCYGVARRREERGEGQSLSPVPEDRLVPPFDSIFEQRVHNRIFDRGHTIIPQYPVGSRSIDLVVVGARGKLAVECDGDRWHGPDRYEADIARQRELQRCGWEFFRVRESEFNIDAAAALAPLWEMVDDLELSSEEPNAPSPAGSELREDEPAPTEPTAVGPAVAEVTPSEEGEPDLVWPSVDTTSGPAPPPQSAVPRASTTAEGHMPYEPGAADVATGTSDEADDAAPREPSAGTDEIALGAYVEWDTDGMPLPDPKEVTLRERTEALRAIVEVEGPILGERLYRLYIKSAGRSRVGRQYKQILNSAAHRAETTGVLLADNPLGQSGQKVKTFRLPDQPEVIARELGPRSIGDVPPAELAAVLAATRAGTNDEEEWFRAVLDRYGLTRLTENTRAVLRRCMPLA